MERRIIDLMRYYKESELIQWKNICEKAVNGNQSIEKGDRKIVKKLYDEERVVSVIGVSAAFGSLYWAYMVLKRVNNPVRAGLAILPAFVAIKASMAYNFTEREGIKHLLMLKYRDV